MLEINEVVKIKQFLVVINLCLQKYAKNLGNYTYPLVFFKIPFSGFVLFSLAGATRRLWWRACDSKLSSLALVRSFSNLSSALKCCACKYKLCSIAKRSLFSNSSTRRLSSTGEGMCLLKPKWAVSFDRLSCAVPFLAPLCRMWLKKRKKWFMYQSMKLICIFSVS